MICSSSHVFGREAALGDDNRGEQMGDKQNAHQETYFFFVGGKKYETDQPALTGLQIKARVADWGSSHDLVLEGHGNVPIALSEMTNECR